MNSWVNFLTYDLNRWAKWKEGSIHGPPKKCRIGYVHGDFFSMGFGGFFDMDFDLMI